MEQTRREGTALGDAYSFGELDSIIYLFKFFFPLGLFRAKKTVSIAQFLDLLYG